MKKNYQKPEIISVDMMTENYILGGSIGVDPDHPEISAAGKNRGEWGDIWSK